NATIRLDHVEGRTSIWSGGDQCAVQEPVFVPRHAYAPEGDGFLLVVVSDFRAQRTLLRILDTGRDDPAPVATAWLPFLIPMALHGTFVPRVQIDHSHRSDQPCD